MIAQPPPLPSSRAPRPGVPPAAPKSLWWLWTILGLMGFLGLLVLGVLAWAFFKDSSSAAPPPPALVVSDLGLLEDREGHVHEWLDDVEFEASGPAAAPDGTELELVRYPSADGELAAYLTPDPGDGKRRPAVVWAKGGFGGIGSYLWEEADPSDDQSARAFLDRDLVVMCPSWRGENDNPGRFELFYGEVDDLLAAIEFVKQQPHVDPDRVYLAGHSTGGSMVLLAAVTSVDVRAVFCFGGAPDMVSVLSDGVGYGNTPYGGNATRGHELRSAVRYTPFIDCPVFYFEGGASIYHEGAAQMESIGRAQGVDFAAFELPGNHFDILAPVTALVAEKVAADTGPSCDIEFTLEELEERWDAVHNKPVGEVLDRWLADGGDLEEMLSALGEDVAADDVGDVAAMEKAIERCASLAGDEASQDMAVVVSMIEESYDDEVLIAFEDDAAKQVHRWLLKKAEGGPSEVEQAAMLDVVETLIWNVDPRVAQVVCDWLEEEFASGHAAWGEVFEALQPDDSFLEPVLASFGGKPPTDETGALLLNRINRLYFDEDWEGENPFDNPIGAKALKGWLAPDSEYAFQAGFGLAFVSDETREGLVPLGLKHPSGNVRMEVAWSDVRTEGELGLDYLKKACLDENWSKLAVSYLEELELEDEVPAQAREPDFAAKAAMADWLRHPSELGEPPKTLEEIALTELFWPPADERREMRIFRFTYSWSDEEPTKTSYGFVGSTTWSTFATFEEEPSIEELYAMQCALELNWEVEDDDERVSDPQAMKLLKKHNPEFGVPAAE